MGIRMLAVLSAPAAEAVRNFSIASIEPRRARGDVPVLADCNGKCQIKETTHKCGKKNTCHIKLPLPTTPPVLPQYGNGSLKELPAQLLNKNMSRAFAI